DADMLVVSDHGAGPLLGDINLGAWLAANGFATYAEPRRSLASRVAWGLPPPIRKLGRRVAPGLARRAMSSALVEQLGPFEWPATRAFAGVNNDLWLNLAEREPDGNVGIGEAPEMIDQLRAGLGALTDTVTGAPVFAATYTRDELYSGSALAMAPDLMLDAWSAGYRVSVKRGPSDELVIPPGSLAGVREAWSSEHRVEGILVAAGPRIARGEPDAASLYDVAPTMLALLEQAVPETGDGNVLTDTIVAAFLEAHPPTTREVADRTETGDYSEEDAAAVASHLKDLGYIE
ncbi:MAG: alkaline phosphatase family protein, partial [Actinomycetota bacterium]|nr:alkaline phosphatase family protein [Actinomycetota bacterium]